MKRKMFFDITVGSHWPEGESLYPRVPEGGRAESVTVEYEWPDPNYPTSFDAAADTLRAQMDGQEYHIWFWWDAE